MKVHNSHEMMIQKRTEINCLQLDRIKNPSITISILGNTFFMKFVFLFPIFRNQVFTFSALKAIRKPDIRNNKKRTRKAKATGRIELNCETNGNVTITKEAAITRSKERSTITLEKIVKACSEAGFANKMVFTNSPERGIILLNKYDSLIRRNESIKFTFGSNFIQATALAANEIRVITTMIRIFFKLISDIELTRTLMSTTLKIKKDTRMLINRPGSQRNNVFITDFSFNHPPIAILP